MKSNKTKEIWYLDDFELQDHLAANLGRYYSSDMVEQKDYSLENFSECGDGFNVSLRVENLSTSDSYLIQKFVA